METADDWVNLIGVLLVLGGILVAPLTIFRRLRRFAGTALMNISYAFGAVLWIICAVSVYAAWGGAILIMGILFLGVGPLLSKHPASTVAGSDQAAAAWGWDIFQCQGSSSCNLAAG